MGILARSAAQVNTNQPSNVPQFFKDLLRDSRIQKSRQSHSDVNLNHGPGYPLEFGYAQEWSGREWSPIFEMARESPVRAWRSGSCFPEMTERGMLSYDSSPRIIPRRTDLGYPRCTFCKLILLIPNHARLSHSGTDNRPARLFACGCSNRLLYLSC